MSKVRVIFEFDHVMHEVKPAGNDSKEITEGGYCHGKNRT